MDAEVAKLILQGLQPVILLLGVLMTLRSVRKSRDFQATHFVIQSEGALDPIRLELMRQEASVIRRTFHGRIPASYSDNEVKVFLFYFLFYSFLSRIYFLLSDKGLDIGLDKAARKEVIESWVRTLRIYRDDEIMREVHKLNLEDGDMNERFRARVEQELGTLEELESL